MKSLLYALLIIAPLGILAQTNDNCVNAIPLCSNPSFTFFTNSGPGSIVDFSVPAQSNISNPNPNPNPPNAGCLLSGELNPQWLLLTVGSAGSLEFVFGAGNSANPQAGFYDWIMWPYSPATCAGIFNNTLPPIRCNWNASSSGGTGMASPANYSVFSGNSGNFESPLLVNACQQFIICISNYSGVNTLVSFLNLGTASLSCNPNCNPNYAMCAGGSASIVPVNFASLTSPSYSMQPGNLVSSTGTFVVSPLVTTSYTTYITGINASNAVQTLTSVSIVTVNAQPSASPTTTQSTCSSTISAFNLGLTFNPATPVPGYTVSWSPQPSGVTSASQVAYSGSISAGQYNATITSVGGCSTTTSFSINPQPVPPSFTWNPAGSVFTVTCSNPTITLNASDPGLTYNWVNGVSAPISGPVGSFDLLGLGNWSVTATDPVSNCQTIHTFTVVQNTTPPTSTITPVFQLITCTNSAIQTITTMATPSINIEHQFYWGNGLNVTGIYSGTAIIGPPPGTHTYVLINLVNGCKVTKTFTVGTTSGFPTFTLSSPIQNYSIGCVPKHIVDINIVGGNTDPPGGQVTYTILSPGFLGTYTTAPASSYTFNAPGQYTVVTRDPVSGCETKSPFSVIQNTIAPDISVAIPAQTLSCFTPSVHLVGTSATPNSGYQWFFPGGAGVLPGAHYTVNTTANQSTTLIATYTFVVTDNNNACKNQTLVPIWQNIFAPLAKITPPSGNTAAISCKTPTLVLTNGSTTGIPPGLFPSGGLIIGVEWTGPSPQPTVNNSSSYLAEIPGTYSLTVRDMNNGCYSSTVFPVGDNRDYPVVNNPVAPPNATLDCGAAAATVSANITGTVPVKYVWSDDLGVIKTATLSSGNGVATASVSKVGAYRVYVINESNGCSSISSANVVNGIINSAFNADKESGFAPLTVNFNNNSSSSLNSLSITSVWNFGNGYTITTTPTLLVVSTVYNQPGNYTVTLYSSKGSCLDSSMKVIHVELPSKLEVPNVFTPNGDGNNDLFFLRTSSLSQLKMSIYDRWGNLVYEVESSTGNVEWNGKNQYGKDVAEGTYFYILTASGKDDKAYDTKGTVNLYR
ncbi:MAG TPA: gliding motility-associated C-terminal domain-containing protein [Bacteroidia bacterium]|nr:gliding motility-associated C-terminal domain-containing protein [Bacteroidia bacterium]